MLSHTQKLAIFQGILKSYTVSGKAYMPSVLYWNQAISSYPVILLNYPTQNIASVRGFVFSQAQYPEAILSINVYAQDDVSGVTKVSGAKIAWEIIRLLIDHIETNWVDYGISSTVTLKDIGQVRELTDLEGAENNLFRLQFDVRLLYLKS